MGNESNLVLHVSAPVKATAAGLAVTQGVGEHPTRTLSSHELIFVAEGKLAMFEGDREFEVSAGEALCLWPDRRHGPLRPYARDLSFYWIHFLISGGRPRQARGATLHVPKHAEVSRPDHLKELFRRYIDDQESGWLRPDAAGLLMMLMLVEVAETRPAERQELRGPDALAARARRHMRSRLASSITASDVADAIGCNPDYLGRVYRRAYGVPLTTDLHRMRIGRARHFLLDSQMNIDEVARACGFTDPGYFRRIFRRIENMSPGAYRRLYGRVHVNLA